MAIGTEPALPAHLAGSLPRYTGLEEDSMALADQPAFPRIVRAPETHGGEPMGGGPRVPIKAIVAAGGAEPDMRAILEASPRLSADDVKDALAYYETHR